MKTASIDSDIYDLKCPHCGSVVQCSKEHLFNNDLVGCMDCNKAFDVSRLVERLKAGEVDEF